MAIPRYWAKAIWLAAIEESTGSSDIDTTSDWETYMAEAQLKNAFNLTNKGLISHGYQANWKLTQLKDTNPIDKQIDLLAATTSSAAQLSPTQAMTAKFALRHNI